jgi:undecaprenyl-diphosphatase
MLDWIAAVLLGLVEGVTEFIPVSSTGHLKLVEILLGIKKSDLFNIVIQCGAVLAVIPLFWTRIQQFACNWRERETRDFILKIALAFGITGAVGFVLDKRGLKLPDNALPIALALLIGGVLFVLIEHWLKDRPLGAGITWKIAIAAAIGQLIAMVFPGASRSGTTILIMLALGLNRPLATEFSFLIGIPTMLAAGGWKIFKALHHPPPGTTPEDWAMLMLSFTVAAVVSFVVVKWLLRYVQTHTFTAFGWYRVALAIVIFALLVLHK